MSEPMAATPMMQSVGLSFGDLTDYARKAVHLLQTVGDDAVDVLEQGFKLWNAISSRDLSAVLKAFAEAKNDIEAIIAAVKAEFGI